MATLDTIPVADFGIARKKNEPLSIWYGQPFLRLTSSAPFTPVAGVDPSSLQILRAILQSGEFLNTDCKPAIVVLPELAIPYDAVPEARALIAAAPKGTLVIFGVAQMTQEQALSIEDKPALWDGTAAGRFANCAVVAFGGCDTVFLQPKLLSSALEQDTHWPGRVIRCFVGGYLRFATFICSDLLNRAGGSSYMHWLHDELERETQKLTVAFWLQHNAKPRSSQFSNAVQAAAKMTGTTIVVAGSRMAHGGKRFENYAVSGGYATRAVFPSAFARFTHRFHYVEQTAADVSRVVLLRYDADAYRVRTVLADDLDASDKVEKGELFSDSQPYVVNDGVLTVSTEHTHLRDLCRPAQQLILGRLPAANASIDAVLARLIELKTADFLAFLDIAILPRPIANETPHTAGGRHAGGDLRCGCWTHRKCVDLLTEEEGVISFAATLEILVILEQGNCQPKPRCDPLLKTNIDLFVSGATKSCTVVYPHGLSLDEVQRLLFGERPPSQSRHVLFVADPMYGRPRATEIDVAVAPSVGGVSQGSAATPLIAAIRSQDIKEHATAGDLALFLDEHL